MNHRFLKSELKLLSIMQTSDTDYLREEDLTLEKQWPKVRWHGWNIKDIINIT